MGYLKKKISIPYQFKEGDEKEIIIKVENFCAYTERCEADVIKKLKSWKVPKELFPEITEYLKEQKFIHQERFGQLFTNGKFKLKGWGKQKIKVHLKSKQVDDIIIEESLSAIEDEVYLEKLNQILSLKLKTMKQEDLFTMKGKLYRYALQKGYESSLISKWLEEKSFE